MLRSISAAMLCVFLLPASPLFAAGLTVAGDSPRDNITLTVEDMAVVAILQNLGAKYGFEIGGMEKVEEGGDTLSVTVSGSLYGILERLLRNRNHVIIRSADTASGIERVILIGADHGARQSKAAQRGAAANDPEAPRGAYPDDKKSTPRQKVGSGPDE